MDILADLTSEQRGAVCGTPKLVLGVLDLVRIHWLTSKQARRRGQV